MVLPEGPVGSAAHGLAAVTPERVAHIFPAAPASNIEVYLPAVLDALRDANLTDRPMVLAALATIRAETDTFEATDEQPSPYNSSPGGQPFDLYDFRVDLGNHGPPDGERYRGRGFVQLTGRVNYAHYGQVLGLGKALVEKPERANEPIVAGRLLARFLAEREQTIREALAEEDLGLARRLVDGGGHGLDRFTDAYRRGLEVLP
jgi:putative chitinase